MKTIAAMMIVLALTGCSTQHSHMDNAYVGTVEGKLMVLRKVDFIRNGQVMYRPQFSSDCPYGGIYQMDYTSTNCYIRESLITDLHNYRDHEQAEPVRHPRTTIGYVRELPSVPGEY